ncbi:MAG: helix-turn-helix domain-containing protein [Pseudomonadota bacterium]
METIDLVIRSSLVGIGALLIIHFLSTRPFSRKTLSAIAMITGSMGLVIVSSIAYLQFDQQSDLWQQVRIFVVSFHAPLIAWGILELFEDEFKVQWWHIGFVLLAIPTHYLANIHPFFAIACHFSSLVMYVYIFYVAINTRQNDLVQARCMFRLWFMSAAAIAGIVFSGLHFVFGDYGMPHAYHILKGAVMLILCNIFAYWVLKIRDDVWALPNGAIHAVPKNLSPAEMALLGKLNASMENDIWKQEGLTIRKLAEALHTPEHRLRKVINQGMGYRNFAHFVNEHRIGAACEVLADPVRADVPIISIAYEVGYASLGPFNRAFRDIVGESPTEFRKRSFAHG